MLASEMARVCEGFPSTIQLGLPSDAHCGLPRVFVLRLLRYCRRAEVGLNTLADDGSGEAPLGLLDAVRKR